MEFQQFFNLESLMNKTRYVYYDQPKLMIKLYIINDIISEINKIIAPFLIPYIFICWLTHFLLFLFFFHNFFY